MEKVISFLIILFLYTGTRFAALGSRDLPASPPPTFDRRCEQHRTPTLGMASSTLAAASS